MKLGQRAMEQLQSEVTGRLRPGDELLVIGEVALKGTSLLAEQCYDKLKAYFSSGFLCTSRELYQTECAVDMVPKDSQVWKMALEAGASALYPMGEGGFLSALWKMAQASEVGLKADLRKVPIRQETIEICELFDLNPYQLYAKGAILVGISAGEALAQEYRRMGISAAVIGQADSGNDRLLYSGENVRYLDRPAPDELKGVLEAWQD